MLIDIDVGFSELKTLFYNDSENCPILVRTSNLLSLTYAIAVKLSRKGLNFSATFRSEA